LRRNQGRANGLLGVFDDPKGGGRRTPSRLLTVGANSLIKKASARAQLVEAGKEHRRLRRGR